MLIWDGKWVVLGVLGWYWNGLGWYCSGWDGMLVVLGGKWVFWCGLGCFNRQIFNSYCEAITQSLW